MAIALATSLCNHELPENRYYDQNSMRGHLAAFINSQLPPFPHLSEESRGPADQLMMAKLVLVVEKLLMTTIKWSLKYPFFEDKIMI